MLHNNVKDNYNPKIAYSDMHIKVLKVDWSTKVTSPISISNIDRKDRNVLFGYNFLKSLKKKC
jgi:hypothetical protein